MRQGLTRPWPAPQHIGGDVHEVQAPCPRRRPAAARHLHRGLRPGENAAEPGANTQPEAPAEEEVEAPAEAPAAEGEPFVVGILGPFTGPSARNGEEFRNSAEMAFEAIDYNIRPAIEVIVDSQSDPEKATRAHEEAIVRAAWAAAINWHSSVSVAVMELPLNTRFPLLRLRRHRSRPLLRPGSRLLGHQRLADPDKLSQNYVTALEEAISLGEFDPGEEKSPPSTAKTRLRPASAKALPDSSKPPAGPSSIASTSPSNRPSSTPCSTASKNRK